MKRLLFAVVIGIFLSSLVSGCLYAKIKVPLDSDVSETELGDKVGKASFQSALWLFSWGDGGTQAAAANGQITMIEHLDSEYFVVLFGLYTRVTTIAYGE